MPTILDLAAARWRFRDTSAPKTWLPATVPGCVHTDLIAAGKIPDPFYGTNELDLQWIENRDWEYQTTFTVTAALLREDIVELCADGLDTVATVTLNGKKIATTDNMFVAHRWNVKKHLHAGRNELVVHFRSAMDYIAKTRTDFTPPNNFNDAKGGGCVRIRKEQCQFGWDWGPRFVTAGIWRGLRLEARTTNRLAHVHVAQTHHQNGDVSLSLSPELQSPAQRVTYWVTLSLGGRGVVTTSELGFEVPSPQLWWPAGQGEQPLYDLVVTARDAQGRDLGTITKRIGLRTIVLDCSPDQWGESFRFLVNGRPVFIKGANWIPADSFATRLDRAAYARDLNAAVLANMNCIRVWGGGIYESEDFYDLCDELGLLVWQDFMFACNLYPSDKAFLASVKTEAEQQVARLHHRACLALWCGNNELVQLNLGHLLDQPEFKAGYLAIFHELLPAAVAAFDGATPYWPSSEWRGNFIGGHEHGEIRGDTHFWDVWHVRKPVKDYEKWSFRFCSEFGMQSYSSPQTNATFCPPGDDNVFGPSMENHQKNRAGNQIILDYVSRRYRFPKDQDSLVWLSQLNQAYCMQVGVEHYRRLMPRCMGAIYWQLNDCWPVASWSSIEYTGRWKALHYAARRFNAPALVSAHVPGDETATVGNYRATTVREVHLFTVYDAPKPAKGLLRWDLFTLAGDIVLAGKKNVALRHGESIRQKTLDLAKPMAAHGRDNLYLRIALDVDGALASEQTVFLSPPRFLDLPKARTKTALRLLTPTQALITVESPVFQHAFTFEFGDAFFTATDNGFDLYPNEKKEVLITLAEPTTKARLAAALTHRSLADTY